MLATARAHPVLAGFTLAYLAVFLVVGLAIGSDVVLPYVALIVAAVALVCRLHSRYDLGGGTLWGMSLWGFGHLAGGVVPIGGGRVLYNAVLPVELFHFDRLVHAFGFGFATVVCGKVLLRFVPEGRLAAASAVLVLLAGLGVGALNEIVEFGATLVLPETNVGGYVNTGWDLVFD
ncbi:MAG TPA: DUF2238 domain-containing protein, partial [Acidimicrobiales bacterium]|nr:DUF2238 domain-containing protein [Acidimicrobiales bacterium]